MNAVTKRWIEALRSGKYQQGKGVLRTRDNKFCCLGVLCDVVAPEMWERHGEKGWRHLGHNGSANQMFWSKIQLPDLTQIELANMNDRDVPFEDIANYIEEVANGTAKP